MSKSPQNFPHQAAKLYQIWIYGRWLFVVCSWLTLGSYALWNLRAEIAIVQDYFTWAAVYYGLHFNTIPTLCLAFCIGTTVAVIVWQVRNLIWGLPSVEQRKLFKQVEQIQTTGRKHPLWKWINS